jgi:hypothetical protein
MSAERAVSVVAFLAVLGAIALALRGGGEKTPHDRPQQAAPVARGFRLHLGQGRVYDGAEFPSGFVVVLEDPEYGLAVTARNADDLLRGYGRGRIEWPATAEDEGAQR